MVNPSTDSKYIRESGAKNYIPKGSTSSIIVANLTGKNTPEVCIVYSIDEIFMNTSEVIILQYNESLNTWGIIYRKLFDSCTMKVAGKFSNMYPNRDGVICSSTLDGTGLYTQALAFTYDDNGKSFNYEFISSDIADSGTVTIDEKKQIITFTGNFNVDNYIWNGKEFTQFTNKLAQEKDINADLEIHFSIIDDEIVSEYKNGHTFNVKVGDVVKFVQDNASGELRKFFVGECFKNYEDEKYVLQVVNTTPSTIRFRTNVGDWMIFNFSPEP